MTSTISPVICRGTFTSPNHHIELARKERLHHFSSGRRIISPVAVTQNVNICLNVCKHAAHYMTFSLSAFVSNDRASQLRKMCRFIDRIIIVYVNFPIRKSRPKTMNNADDGFGFVITWQQNGNARVFIGDHSLPP